MCGYMHYWIAQGMGWDRVVGDGCIRLAGGKNPSGHHSKLALSLGGPISRPKVRRDSVWLIAADRIQAREFKCLSIPENLYQMHFSFTSHRYSDGSDT